MMPYTPPAEQHIAADHRYVWHGGELAACGPCNRPTTELVASRARTFARQVEHPENRGDAVQAELVRWYLADRVDIEAGRPLSYMPDLP